VPAYDELKAAMAAKRKTFGGGRPRKESE